MHSIPRLRESTVLSTSEAEGGSLVVPRVARASRPARARGRTAALRTVAFFGNHSPRQCGIAAFTADLASSVAAALPEAECLVVAINKRGRRHEYPEAVRFEVDEGDIASYERAAEFLNEKGADVVSLQHEYGIFGGSAGSHVLAFMQALRVPIVTTLHTVLAAPDPAQLRVLKEVARLSERVVVMSEHGAELLVGVYGIDAAKIDRIPHGIPDVPVDGQSKRRLGLGGKFVILTFGLLSPDKGIEHVIDALPAVTADHPNVVYVVLGATHPQIRDEQGERYRTMLMERARALGVADFTLFQDRFVSQSELNEYLAAADIYITPYLKEEQITSGTLAYAVGSGKAVISTPYLYARELLAGGRGIVAPWRDSSAIAREVGGLLADGEKRSALGARALAHGRLMRWPVVARSYARAFGRARATHQGRALGLAAMRRFDGARRDLPETKLDHLRALTDDVGLFQHALGTIPNFEHGYCLDDNARALLLTTLVDGALFERGLTDRAALRELGTRYARFVSRAFHRDSGRFRNFMSHSRRWLEPIGSEDSHARAIWALGTVVGRSSDAQLTENAARLFDSALPATREFTSPRAWAYTLLGIAEHVRSCRGDSGAESVRDELAGRLLDLYERTHTPAWPWFEREATYCNARLSQALIVSASWTRDARMLAAGVESLEWLVRVQRSRDGYYAPIGSNGFYERDGFKAAYDQQPVEACSMVSACLTAGRATGDGRWTLEAERAFFWFLGKNTLSEPLYDESSGGCRDGLHIERPNENQGAEATLSFQMALAEMRSFKATPGPAMEA